ncbi:clotting factor G beta subunit-like [Oratosquilla oratoria]|uniref:clotting factor G beta subunit-like n=1 Tax=Oratosquilla oratoria TaxID=337810 RepID=UPI003F766F08
MATVQLVSQSACQDSYQAINYIITDNMVCAAYPGRDACQGDSGGPIMIEKERGIFVLVGVVSFGYECANPNFPGVYTAVSKYNTWIRELTGSIEC